MRALYEIDKDILDCVDAETGEILDIDKLNALEMERDAKVEAVCLWYKDTKAEAEAIGNEIKALQARKKTLDNLMERLKNYTGSALAGEKFKTSKVSVSYRKSTSVVIDDITAVPKNYFKEPKEDWISKTLIAEAFDHGVTVKGAHAEDKQSTIIK